MKKPRLPHDVQLKAWNLWKEVCCFNGCNPETPLVQQKIKDGKGTQKEYQVLYKYLVKMVVAGFKKALEARCGLLALQLKSHQQFIDNKEILTIVEEGMCELKSRNFQSKGPVLKAYKDYVWHKALCSSDPAVNVIWGDLHFRLIDIAVRYVKSHYDASRVKGKNYLELVDKKSIYDSVGAEENLKLEDVIPDERNSDERWRTAKCFQDCDQSIKTFYQSLNFREKIIMLAKICEINVTDLRVEKALGVKRDGCSLAWISLKEKISKMPRFDATAISTLKDMLFSELKSEKVAKPFFKELEARKKKEVAND